LEYSTGLGLQKWSNLKDFWGGNISVLPDSKRKMKKILLLTCLFFTCLSASADKIKAKSSVHLVSTRMDIFYFKIDKTFLGAELEIYSQDGVKLFTEKLDRRKILIDFYFENPGKFIIMFKKGDRHEEFSFIKTEPCLEVEKPTVLISVTQGI
jgi:hypothetical protein